MGGDSPAPKQLRNTQKQKSNFKTSAKAIKKHPKTEIKLFFHCRIYWISLFCLKYFVRDCRTFNFIEKEAPTHIFFCKEQLFYRTHPGECYWVNFTIIYKMLCTQTLKNKIEDHMVQVSRFFWDSSELPTVLLISWIKRSSPKFLIF